MQHDAALLECLSFTNIYSFVQSSFLSSCHVIFFFLLDPKNILLHQICHDMQTLPVANLYFYVCEVILSALRNLQEKIRRLEMVKGHAERSLHALGKDASQTLLQNEDITPRLLNDQKDPERQRSAHSNCNQGEYR